MRHGHQQTHRTAEVTDSDESRARRSRANSSHPGRASGADRPRSAALLTSVAGRDDVWRVGADARRERRGRGDSAGRTATAAAPHALILHRDRVVSVERLGELVWGEDTAVDAAALQSLVFRLRKRVGGLELEYRSPGYVLRIPDDRLDAAWFERLVLEAVTNRSDAPDASLRMLDRALELWRGEPFDDLVDTDDGRVEIVRLAELRSSRVSRSDSNCDWISATPSTRSAIWRPSSARGRSASAPDISSCGRTNRSVVGPTPCASTTRIGGCSPTSWVWRRHLISAVTTRSSWPTDDVSVAPLVSRPIAVGRGTRCASRRRRSSVARS